MTDAFTLELEYAGKHYVFEVSLQQMSKYTHRLVVEQGAFLLYVERDEERNYRALLPETASEHPPQGLVIAITEKIQQLLEDD